ncbi:hypothetical protein AOLI_G00069860 [Acnodon oligacanthus]
MYPEAGRSLPSHNATKLGGVKTMVRAPSRLPGPRAAWSVNLRVVRGPACEPRAARTGKPRASASRRTREEELSARESRWWVRTGRAAQGLSARRRSGQTHQRHTCCSLARTGYRNSGLNHTVI